MKKIIIRTMQFLFVIFILLVVGGLLYMRHDRFGANPKGARLALMESKPNYKNGAFDNL